MFAVIVRTLNAHSDNFQKFFLPFNKYMAREEGGDSIAIEPSPPLGPKKDKFQLPTSERRMQIQY